jgi:penicillin-binding protein 2
MTVPKESYRIPLKQEDIDFVKSAMVGVNKPGGTGAAAFAGAGYVSGGKSGTAQVATIKQNEKYDAKHVAQNLRDHSLFTAFAPADHPTIALAVIVENGGWGAAAAGPLARKALDYYLLKKRPGDVVTKADAAKVDAVTIDPATGNTSD